MSEVKRKKSLEVAIKCFSETVTEINKTLLIYLDQMKLIERIINDKLKKL
jgi:hypothetical protein